MPSEFHNSGFRNTKHSDTLKKAGHTVIMPNATQSSSRVSDCYLLWIYYLDDTDEEVSRISRTRMGRRARARLKMYNS